jgi:hypothetical protein
MILTNGMLALRQPDEFWRCLRENSTRLQVTKYPIDVDYDAIEERCKSESIEFAYHDGDVAKETFIMQAINPEGSGEPWSNFGRCSLRTCTVLKDGRLYPCVIIPSITHFNKYFGKNIPVSEQDSIDIYACHSGRDAFRRLWRRQEPWEFCKYCDMEAKLASSVKFERSHKRISEWVAR